MARTTLTLQSIITSGLTPSYSAVDATNGNEVDNTSGAVILHVKTGASATDVTVQTGGKYKGHDIADDTISIGTNSEAIIGPYTDRHIYNQSDGKLYIDFTVGTSVTIAALQGA